MRISIEDTYAGRKLNKSKIITTILVILLLIALIYRLYYENQVTIGIMEQEQDILNTKEELEVVNMQLPILTQQGIDNVKNIYNSEQKIAYLTFDDGPSIDITPKVLDLLKEENIKATFFVLGLQVDKNPEILRRTYEEGHYIANHGYSHVYSSIYSSTQAVLDEYNYTEAAIRKAINIPEYNSHLFRFPGGSSGGSYHDVKQEAELFLEQNMIVSLDWNALTNDSQGSGIKEELVQSAIDTIGNKNSVVLLMHDSADKEPSYEALKEIITYLKQQGYIFGNMYDLIV